VFLACNQESAISGHFHRLDNNLACYRRLQRSTLGCGESSEGVWCVFRRVLRCASLFLEQEVPFMMKMMDNS
jgi:hypothetical protein